MKQIHIFTIFETPKTFFDGQFKYLADQGQEIILISGYDKGSKAFAERNHIRFIPVDMPRALSPLTILRAIRQLIGIIKRERPDAVFGHTPVGALCAMISAKWCGVRNRIYYRHGVIYTTMRGIRYRVFLWEEKFVSSLATAVINVSHSLSRLALKDGLNSDSKQFVIGHGTCGGIDAVGRFNPVLLDMNVLAEKKRILGLNGADVVFGFCGRICNDKGIPELIDAFGMFRQCHLDIKSKLLLIGTMDSRDCINEHYTSIIQEDEDIILSGRIERDIIPYYYALLDVFVFPSHREGFGMSAIEASAMEKPLLVSKVHGCEDTIVEHLTGEYIGFDAESICKGMEIMCDPDAIRYFGKNGRRKVLEWYDCRVMWPLVSKLYAQIIK